MGESDRYIEYRNKFRPGRINLNINSPVVFIIVINFTVFLFIKFLSFGQITGDSSMAPYFTDKLNAFLVHSSFRQTFTRPWSILTYCFFHFQFLSLVSNMLWLWCFGSILESVAGNRNTFPLYLYGGFTGAIAFLATLAFLQSTVLAPQYFLFGSNAAVMAIAVATTVLAPDFRILRQLGKGIPIWILTLIYVLVDIAGMGTMATPFYSAHLAGAIIGGLYMYSYTHGQDWGLWMNRCYYWFMGLFNPNKGPKSIKEKVFYNTGKQAPFTKKANLTQQRVDEILDKINQKGYKYLSAEEKEILKRASEGGL